MTFTCGMLFYLVTIIMQGCVHLTQNAITIMQPCNNLVTALQSCSNLSTTKLQPYKVAAILLQPRFFHIGMYISNLTVCCNVHYAWSVDIILICFIISICVGKPYWYSFTAKLIPFLVVQLGHEQMVRYSTYLVMFKGYQSTDFHQHVCAV